MSFAESFSPGVAALDAEADLGRHLAVDLAAVTTRASSLLLLQDTMDTVLGMIAALAVETMDECVGAGFTLGDARTGPTSVASTHQVVERADALQYLLGEGPCLEASASRTAQRVDDVTLEQRWPRWARASEQLGLGSALSTPLVAGDLCLGAMKVYGARPGAFGPRTEHLLQLLAAQAALLVATAQSQRDQARTSEDVRVALRQRDLISQAKGILMQSSAVDEDGAFALLVAASERQNQSVYEVADALVAATVRRRR